MKKSGNGGKVFYKMRLVPAEEGLVIVTDQWVSMHETPCYHFCVPAGEKRIMHLFHSKDETDLAYAKRKKKLKRISKDNGRFAFDSKDKALEHLKFLKRKQLVHMKRDALFIEKFLSTPDVQLSKNHLIPESKDLVHEHYVFD